MSGRLDGHVALVTGSGGGIGRAFAERLAADGAAVAVLDIVDPEATAEAIRARGGQSAAFLTDVADPVAVEALAETITSKLGTVDILVNNVGIYPPIDFADITIEAWRRVFAVNVESMFLTTKTFVPAMKDARWGRIVNITSNAVGLKVPGMTHYIASKMAVIGLTRGLASELGDFGITVNAIGPSAVRTPGTSNMPEEGFSALAEMQAIRRSELPEDLVGALAFLVSDDASFVTGQTLYVDGGMVRSG